MPACDFSKLRHILFLQECQDFVWWGGGNGKSVRDKFNAFLLFSRNETREVRGFPQITAIRDAYCLGLTTDNTAFPDVGTQASGELLDIGKILFSLLTTQLIQGFYSI